MSAARVAVFYLTDMLTRKQKEQQVDEIKKILEESRSLVFIDFSGTTVKELEKLRRSLRAIGSNLKVIKKRLLNLAFKGKNIELDTEKFELQLGTVFSPKELYEVAGPVYQSKIKILGGYDLENKNFYDAERMKFLGTIPSREVLLGQLVGVLAAPIRMFLYVLSEKGRKSSH